MLIIPRLRICWLAPGFTPAFGDTFKIISGASSREGTFASVGGPSAGLYRVELRPLHLKLLRRLLLEPLKASGTTVTLTGEVTPPLTKPVAPVTVERTLAQVRYRRELQPRNWK